MTIAIPIHHSSQADYEPIYPRLQEISQRLEAERAAGTASASDWAPFIAAALHSISQDCRQPEWDEAGTCPVEDCTIELAGQIAARLRRMVRKGVPAPDIVPDLDGEIIMSWIVDARRQFSLSIGPRGKVNFAGQFGERGAVHAWQPIDAASRQGLEESLEDISRYIDRLYPCPRLQRVA